ncbi:hypothetical protein FB451DRAFT_1384282 [Mycena latifolia]|nr:hypothetical protein FB451DRAFT_1384282 [Mycena latifolia]
MVGVSVRTIITNIFVQFIILLYLIDNNENTSWMILFGVLKRRHAQRPAIDQRLTSLGVNMAVSASI